ncbi:hypothetical protein JYU34_003981 [Plutella xylostella]|uniref:TIR domain-containing protein n=1 Tax=Plutella xylostella TaxID=51655 RepID=A0ABQ7QWU8_PLUXY|nr:hypothetical protein JYU34_003981 [Plutella xylostella]
MEARGITAVPRVDNVTALLLSGNRIEEVREEDLPDGLEELDLSNNSLRSLPPRALRPPRLRLARNPWRCACPDQPLLDAARERQQHIVDYTSIRCADGRAWAALGAGALCPPAPAPGLAPPAPAPAAAWLALPAALLLAAAAAAVAYYYRYHVKLFLSSHGWPTPAPNATHAPHARYDVFVSFSHADEAWVQRELLPRLQAARTVCVHYNDWVAGEGIPQQIASSVASSHRTLCILSAAAVHAPWPREERRAALAHSSAVLLLLEPVDNLANGEPELKAHLATRTYLTKDDPRLWEKLLVALPPAPRAPAPRAPAPARGKGKGGDKMEKEADKAFVCAFGLTVRATAPFVRCVVAAIVNIVYDSSLETMHRSATERPRKRTRECRRYVWTHLKTAGLIMSMRF